uniref:KHA domain-containing protein n=1 Tax=Quercus lobata TaxID=97700 RepID=A0A7N2LDB3_QUELO
MLARGRMDLPLSLCFAALRGDDFLLQQLLKRGLDPNELDSNGRTVLHIAAAKGSENCVHLLLEYGADPNNRDSDGNVPVWVAMLGGHEPVIYLLLENGAKLHSGDIGQFACTAAEQNNLKLLKEIIRLGGDVMRSKSNGTTALHIAVCEGNTEIEVSFEGIAFESWSQTCPRRRANNFHNSLFGIMSAAHTEEKGLLFPANQIRSARDAGSKAARVTISCPEKEQASGKLVLLPGSFQELLDIAAKKFGILPLKVLSKEGAEIDDIEAIRDGDHLIFKFDDMLEKLKITLLTVTALLNNAEEKQFHSPPVEKRLHMARDALYDAEDILDELATETLRCKLEAESNQILLTLNTCRNCSSLPPLGQLPSLKNLTVEGMDRIKIIGIEFCGDGCSSAMPFPSLETLEFDSMLQWEECHCFADYHLCKVSDDPAKDSHPLKKKCLPASCAVLWIYRCYMLSSCLKRRKQKIFDPR